jgi:hypothetical protein
MTQPAQSPVPPAGVPSAGVPSAGVRFAGVRELLLPLTVLGCFVLYYVLELDGWVVAAASAPMVLLYGLAPVWAESSVASFDRDLVRLLSTGRRSALPGRYARALGMRLFAPPAVSAERRAVVAAENALPREARASYRIALHEHGGRAPLRVLLGYAHACYELTDDDEAIRVYRELLAQTTALPGVRRNLAHALVRRGQALREALELIDAEAGSSAAPERELLRAVAYAKLGEHGRASELAERTRDAEGALADALRLELQRALDGISEARPV